ncbi:hypothetical protein EST38_g7800 [Candolleomyces aberdarensis]|uniref:Uncharacterized protein n=1 Tax=Candolleomyces aberdarensis TaxID=2316362 RepID=A0A4Q2DGE0_9AGAR|nr:hypothetical protein EST38_g7800 [Candolleomyces aberdarensis]
MYHATAALQPPKGHPPHYAQLYVIEPQAALASRTQQNQQLNPIIMRQLQNMLIVNHPFARIYHHGHQILQNHNAGANYEIALRLIPGTNHGVYNLPSNNEYAFILPGTENTEPRDIILRLCGGLLERISDLSPAHVTLQYLLLLPLRTLEWHPELQLVETEAERDG